MNKEDFLNGLRTALAGEMAPANIEENIRYYDEYIETEKRKGKEEAAVFEELGDPRLIAKTLLGTSREEDLRGNSFMKAEEEREEREEEEQAAQKRIWRISRIKAWIFLIALIALAILLLIIVGSVLVALAPVLLAFIVLWLILRSMRGD
ncbi:MAG: DUF1700 domain-containing protein [Lachnospiraceae bacterium]|nr:DUF1700 domain-containing protein [Lachnospiraceae bacterium]